MPEPSIEEYLSSVDYEEGDQSSVPMEGDADASVALRRLAALRRKIDANRALADAETTKIQDWEREVNGPLENQAQFFTQILEGYALHQRETTDGDRKTVKLPAGTLKTTEVKPKWTIDDAEAFIKWARAEKRKDLFRLEYKSEGIAKIKKAFLDDGAHNAIDGETGETIPGLKITPPEQPVNVTITTN